MIRRTASAFASLLKADMRWRVSSKSDAVVAAAAREGCGAAPAALATGASAAGVPRLKLASAGVASCAAAIDAQANPSILSILASRYYKLHAATIMTGAFLPQRATRPARTKNPIEAQLITRAPSLLLS